MDCLMGLARAPNTPGSAAAPTTYILGGYSVSLTLPALRPWEVWREHVSKVLTCLLPPASQPEEEPLGPGGTVDLSPPQMQGPGSSRCFLWEKGKV